MLTRACARHQGFDDLEAADQERVQAIEAGLLELLERWEILERRSKAGGR